MQKTSGGGTFPRCVCVCVCVCGVVLPGKGIIRGRGFENDAPSTKTYDVLTMFFNIENDYCR